MHRDTDETQRSQDTTRARICDEPAMSATEVRRRQAEHDSNPPVVGERLSRADVALLLSAGLKGEIPLTTPVPEALSIARARVRDPATVVDIAQARRRAMPLSEREQFDQDVMLTGAGFLRQWVDELGVPHEQRIPPEQVFLGRLPKPTFRARVDAWVIANRGWLLFWGLCAGFALAVWLGVR